MKAQEMDYSTFLKTINGFQTLKNIEGFLL